MGLFDLFRVEVEQSDGTMVDRLFPDKETATQFAEDADGYGHQATLTEEEAP